MAKIGFIGAGNMAQAIVKGVISAAAYAPQDILVSDIRVDQLDVLRDQYGITPVEKNTDLASTVDVLVLSVKPQIMPAILAEISGCIKSDAIVISIAAGVTTSKITAALGDVPVIRVMPNTPALVGCGMAGLFSANANDDAMQTATNIFSAVGQAIVVATEDLVDSVTAVSGSGPAYFFLLMEQMIAAAQKLGLDEEAATKLVIQTAKGAAILAETSDDSPAQLRQKVTSPGGTTQAALEVFAQNNFDKITEQALTAARDRGKELSK
jgi:pyrroline-5-carboxylate reductase